MGEQSPSRLLGGDDEVVLMAHQISNSIRGEHQGLADWISESRNES
jgi:hypothetical protein